MSKTKPGELYTSAEQIQQELHDDMIDALYDLSPIHPRPWYRRLWSWVRRKLWIRDWK